MQQSYDRLSAEVLDAASAPVRLQVLKLLSSKGPLPYTEIMYESKLDPVRDAGKFVYHLKTLRKAGLVNVEKGTKKYGITELGKVLVEFSRDLEEYLAVKKGRLFVRTSRMTIDEFDRTKIASSLVKEAGMPQSLANEIAVEAEERLLRIGATYLTAPLIRELVNTILVERKLDEYRHKLTRLGLPVNDVTILLREASQKHLDPGWVERSAGNAVAEEYVLLNSLPRDLVDAHLSGQIHLDRPDSWILKPSKFFHETPLILKKGLPGIGPPTSFESAVATLLKLVRIADGEIASEQVFDNFNVYLAPYVKDTPIQRVRDEVRLFLNALNWDGFSNVLPPKFTIAINRKLPENLGRAAAVGPNGKQSGTYSDYQREAEELFRVVLESALELGRTVPVINPSIVVRTDRRTDWSADEMLSLAFENSARNATPNYVMDNFAVSSDGSTLSGNDGPSNHGSLLGTVFINLPRAAYEAKGRDDRLFQLVMQDVRHAVSALDLRRQSIRGRLKEGLLPLFSWHPNGAPYYDEHQASAEVGLLGLDEAITFHAHAPLEEKDSITLVKKIVESARKAVQESEAQGMTVRVGLHGSPEASSRLAQVDAERYGFSTIVHQGSKKSPYYTDMPALPTTRKIPFGRRVAVEGEIQRTIEGDGLVTIPISQKVDAKELAVFYHDLVSSGTRYFTFSKVVSYCQNCYTAHSGSQSKCQNCGSDRIMSVGRCSGRMLPLELWPAARAQDMVHHLTYDASS